MDKRVDCFFVDGNKAGKFALEETTDGKNCRLVTNGKIDRETVERYDLNVAVRYRASTRKKRQGRKCVIFSK